MKDRVQSINMRELQGIKLVSSSHEDILHHCSPLANTDYSVNINVLYRIQANSLHLEITTTHDEGEREKKKENP